MKTLEQMVRNPSGWDSVANYVGKPLSSFSDVYVVVTRSRDSSTLEESNWRSALKRLGGESETVQIYRFGHWACGWWEALCVTGASIPVGEEIYQELEQYPVVDEADWSMLEFDNAVEAWEHSSISEKVRLCQKHNISVFAARRTEFPEDPTGSLVAYLGQ